MYEGTMMSTGWGYVGTNEKGFEWLFTPGTSDPAYAKNPATGKPFPFCCCRSGVVFKSKAAAIRDGKRWMKQAERSGATTAVKPTPRHFDY